jgi:hypothetical protein
MLKTTPSSARGAIAGLALFAALAANAPSANAVVNPGAINWTTPSATAFVTSLYVGVLGRSPESAVVVAGWASQVTTMRSRLDVFNRFTWSKEYRTRFPRGAQGRYTVWANNCPRYERERYSVSAQMPRGSWSAQMNRVTLNYGLAMAGFFRASNPFRRCR